MSVDSSCTDYFINRKAKRVRDDILKVNGTIAVVVEKKRMI